MGYGYLFFPPCLVMLERTWHIAGLYVILCFSGNVVHTVSSVTTPRSGGGILEGVTLGKNELALYYYAN